MKRLIASIALTIASFSTFGQGVTANSETVNVPKKWLQNAAKDLVRYDQCREENSLLKESNSNYKKLVEKEREFSALLQERNRSVELQLVDCRRDMGVLIDNAKARQAQHDKQLKKQRRKGAWSTVAGVLSGIGVGIVAGFLFAQ